MENQKVSLSDTSGIRRGLSDQTLIFGLKIGNTVIYKLYVLQNIEVKINYKNTVIINDKLYENYEFCPDN